MGISTYVCRVPDATNLEAAIRAVVAHNCAAMVPLGGSYTDDEVRRLDPRRAAVSAAILAQLDASAGLVLGFKEKWTRGEDMRQKYCLVAFQDAIWLEVSNDGGGICSSVYLQTQHPHVGWIGTEGKPGGFYEAPCLYQAASFRELREQHAAALIGRAGVA